LVGPQPGEHVESAATIRRLALGQFDRDRHPVRVHKSVDLGGQAATRTPHAPGSSVIPSLGWRGVQTPLKRLQPELTKLTELSYVWANIDDSGRRLNAHIRSPDGVRLAAHVCAGFFSRTGRDSGGFGDTRGGH
jgi:hypothetical protein